MQQLSIIAAMAENRAIGINNALPWHLPEDLKRFKALTMGHHIIMGRKTYESLGRLLPGRTTVIVTRNKKYKIEGAIVTHSLEAAIVACNDDSEIFLIGGAELYQVGLPFSKKLYITEVHIACAADAFFPALAPKDWQEVTRDAQTSKTGLDYSFVIYERVNTKTCTTTDC